jgi:trimethylamine--corrinoid protein Co-methyltransferase
MAGYYGLPSRQSGAITDAHTPDARAGIESALALYTSVNSGVNFILHSCGILSSFLAMSYEKFIIDEELCGMVRNLLKKEEVTEESIGMDEIKSVGIGGMYLDQDRTFRLCKTEFFLPKLMFQENYDSWKASGKNQIEALAMNVVRERLSNYKKPEIDPEIENDLKRYVTLRKAH